MGLETVGENHRDGEALVGNAPLVAEYLDDERRFGAGIKPNAVSAEAALHEAFRSMPAHTMQPLPTLPLYSLSCCIDGNISVPRRSLPRLESRGYDQSPSVIRGE